MIDINNVTIMNIPNSDGNDVKMEYSILQTDGEYVTEETNKDLSDIKITLSLNKLNSLEYDQTEGATGMTAIPDEGFEFYCWLKDGAYYSNEQELRIPDINNVGNEYQAIFKPKN